MFAFIVDGTTRVLWETTNYYGKGRHHAPLKIEVEAIRSRLQDRGIIGKDATVHLHETLYSGEKLPSAHARTVGDSFFFTGSVLHNGNIIPV